MARPPEDPARPESKPADKPRPATERPSGQLTAPLGTAPGRPAVQAAQPDRPPTAPGAPGKSLATAGWPAGPADDPGDPDDPDDFGGPEDTNSPDGPESSDGRTLAEQDERDKSLRSHELRMRSLELRIRLAEFAKQEADRRFDLDFLQVVADISNEAITPLDPEAQSAELRDSDEWKARDRPAAFQWKPCPPDVEETYRGYLRQLQKTGAAIARRYE